MQVSNLEEEFTFCYSQQKPDSLVMLYPPEKVLQKMLRPPDQFVTIWLKNNSTQIPQSTPQFPQKFPQTHILTLPQTEQFLSQNHQKISNIIIICLPSITPQVKFLNRRKQIKAIIQYPVEIGEKDCWRPEEEGDGMGDGIGEMVFQADSENMLGKIVENLCISKPNFRELMNFVPLKGEVWKSNVLVRTMMAMINHQVDLDTRRQILNQFAKMVAKIDSESNFEELIEQLQKGPLCFSRAIYWYTHPVGIYKIMNNLLRSSSHPSEIFSIQPIFKDIFSAIKLLHKKPLNPNPNPNSSLNPSPKTSPNLTCYRGGSIYKAQLDELQNNLGQIIKNLSFLSTSINKDTAQKFMQNVMFEIRVIRDGETLEEEQYEYGYARVEKYSYFYEEEEIVFNPLNSFKVLEVRRQKGQDEIVKYYVVMEYGSLAKLMRKKINQGYQELKETEKCLCGLAKMWKDQESVIVNQGLVLFDQHQNLAGVENYWQKFKQISNNPISKITALVCLAKTQQNKSNFKQSLKILAQAEQIFSTLSPQPQLQPHSQPQPQFQPHPVSQKLLQPQLPKIFWQLQYTKAISCIHLGRYQEVEDICQRGSRAGMTQQWETNQNYLDLQTLLGKALCVQNKSQECEKLLQKISPLQHPHLSTLTPFSTHFLTNLANLHVGMKNYQKSYQIQQKILKPIQLMYGYGHPCHLYALGSLANTLCYLKDYGRALVLFQRCCWMGLQYGGERNRFYVSSVRSLAETCYKAGEFQKSQQLFQKYFQLESTLTETQQTQYSYINGLRNYSAVLTHHAKYKNSFQILLKCRDLSLKLFGQDHILYLNCLDDLGAMLHILGHSKQAKEILETCLERKVRVFGERCVEVVRSLGLLGIVGVEGGEVGVGVWVGGRIGELDLRGYDTQVIEIVDQLTLMLIKSKNYQIAQTLILNLLKQPQLPNTPSPKSLQILLQTYTSILKHNRCLTFLQKCHQTTLSIFPPHSQQSLHILFQICWVLYEDGRFQEAVGMLRGMSGWVGGMGRGRGKGMGKGMGEMGKDVRVVRVWEEDRRRYMQLLGEVCLGIGEYQEALNWWIRVLGKVKPGNRQIQCLNTIAKTWQHLGQYKKSLSILKKSQKLIKQTPNSLNPPKKSQPHLKAHLSKPKTPHSYIHFHTLT